MRLKYTLHQRVADGLPVGVLWGIQPTDTILSREPGFCALKMVSSDNFAHVWAENVLKTVRCSHGGGVDQVQLRLGTGAFSGLSAAVHKSVENSCKKLCFCWRKWLTLHVEMLVVATEKHLF